MVRPQDAVDEIVDILDNNLSDPSKIDRNNWIFWDEPRPDSAKPRIGVHLVDGPFEPAGLNSDKFIQSARIQVTVAIDKKNKFDIDDDGEPERPTDVLDYFSDQVFQTIKGKHDTFRTEGFIHAIPLSSTNVNPEGEKRRNMDFEVKFTR